MTGITDYNPSLVCGIQLGANYVHFVILLLLKRKLGVVYSIMSVGSTLGPQGSADMISQVEANDNKYLEKGSKAMAALCKIVPGSRWCEIEVLNISYQELLGKQVEKKLCMIILDCFLNHTFKKGIWIGLKQFLSYFSHTRVLESNNSMITKYVPQRMAFE